MNVAVTAKLALSPEFLAARDAVTPTDTEHVVPDDIRGFLARLRLLNGVPFAYLAADSDLLPPESIRFFYIDRAWTDALVQGVLSVGTITTVDRAQLEAVYTFVRDEVDLEERAVRLPKDAKELTGAAGIISGFLLRSRAVSGWPGLHVRGYRTEPATRDDEMVPEDDPSRLKVLRMERLAPAVLLVLFDGIPEVVHVEEPRSGIQFGVDLHDTDTPNRYRSTTKARDALTGDKLGGQNGIDVDVPFRRGAPGVIDVTRLADKLNNTAGTNLGQHGPEVDGAEFAVEMLRFPYRQVFGDPRVETGILDVFRPLIALTDVAVKYREVLDR